MHTDILVHTDINTYMLHTCYTIAAVLVMKMIHTLLSLFVVLKGLHMLMTLLIFPCIFFGGGGGGGSGKKHMLKMFVRSFLYPPCKFIQMSPFFHRSFNTHPSILVSFCTLTLRWKQNGNYLPYISINGCNFIRDYLHMDLFSIV